MVKPKLRVSIIIPNWNGEKLLAKNLPKVISAASDAEVIVVDDHSKDNSVEIVKTRFPKVKIIVKEVNSGFAQTVNMGVVKAQGDVIVLINSDVVPDEDFLNPILMHFSDPLVFGVGCMEKDNENGKIVLRGRGVAHWQKGFYIHERGEVNKYDTAWIAGGSGAFRKSLWNKLGGFDTVFSPFYWEDIDLSYRARKAGYKIVFEVKSVVSHYHQQGAIKTQFQKEHVQRIVFRNQFIFIWKNLTDVSLWIQHLFWAPIRIVQECMKGHTMMLFGFFLALEKIIQVIRSRNSSKHLFKKSDKQIAVY